MVYIFGVQFKGILFYSFCVAIAKQKTVSFLLQEGSCESLKEYQGRNNAKGVDLNRDFPDQFDSNKSDDEEYLYGGRQPETVALMKWVTGKQFVLSGNLHGGAVVASYPYDDSM